MPRKEFLASLALHLLALYFLSLGTSGGNPPGGTAKAEQKKEEGADTVEVTLGEILPKPAEKEEAIVKPDPEISQDALVAAAHNSQECPDFYGGIGVMYDLSDGITYTVETVVAGYPAARAGIRPGDVIMRPPHAIRGPVGTPILIPVLRGGEHLEFSLTREKICITKQEKRRIDNLDKLMGTP